jgi:hypothetical protein
MAKTGHKYLRSVHYYVKSAWPPSTRPPKRCPSLADAADLLRRATLHLVARLGVAGRLTGFLSPMRSTEGFVRTPVGLR